MQTVMLRYDARLRSMPSREQAGMELPELYRAIHSLRLGSITNCTMQDKARAAAASKAKAEEQARRDSLGSGRSRIKREKEEHAARGPAPQPCRDFRLPRQQVPTLLMIWELTQVDSLLVGMQLHDIAFLAQDS